MRPEEFAGRQIGNGWNMYTVPLKSVCKNVHAAKADMPVTPVQPSRLYTQN